MPEENDDLLLLETMEQEREKLTEEEFDRMMCDWFDSLEEERRATLPDRQILVTPKGTYTFSSLFV